MSEEGIRIENAEKRPMMAAILAFVLPTVAIVAVNTWLRGEFMARWSISRYVGSETWSVILFLMSNFVVAANVLKYLYIVGEKWGFSRGYFYAVVAMMIGLVGLSVCPVGYFDLAGSAYGSSVPSHVHEICSKMMFFSMIVVAGMMIFCQRASHATRMVAALYVAYGAVCVFGYFTRAGWFLSRVLMFESCYLFGFLAFCLGLQGRKKVEEEHE